MSKALYPEQSPEQLGEYYMRHVAAMTSESLHAKSAIAEQLAWRDREIDRLRFTLRQIIEADDLKRQVIDVGRATLNGSPQGDGNG